MDKKITIADLYRFKHQNCKIVAVSCYDYTTAKIVSQTNVQMILVGDSAAQIVLGFDSTLQAKMDFMTTITAAVRRGAPDKFLVADMPFLSYQLGNVEAIRNAGRFITEAGAQMVKIEATQAHLDIVKSISNSGIAVMAHIGLLPQNIGKIGHFKTVATTADAAMELIILADKMVDCGAQSLLLEATAAEVAEIITKRFDVPIISCGSGPACDGQILVITDILGLTQGTSPKFVKRFGNLTQNTIDALNAYSKEIDAGQFPNDEHSYHMKPAELERLHTLLKKKS